MSNEFIDMMLTMLNDVNKGYKRYDHCDVQYQSSAHRQTILFLRRKPISTSDSTNFQLKVNRTINKEFQTSNHLFFLILVHLYWVGSSIKLRNKSTTCFL